MALGESEPGCLRVSDGILAQKGTAAINMGRVHLLRNVAQAQEYGNNISKTTLRMGIESLIQEQRGSSIAIAIHLRERMSRLCAGARAFIVALGSRKFCLDSQHKKP